MQIQMFLLFVCFVASVDAIRVGAFNIQVFGREKLRDAQVAQTIAKIVSRYDLLFVQEIRDLSGEAFPQLVAEVQKISGRKFDFVISERLGRTDSKEQYAYLFDRSKQISVASTWVAASRKFERPPFVADIRIGKNRVAFIGLHATPSDVANELGAIPAVLRDVEERLGKGIPQVILGDLNADCAYLCASCMSGVKLHSDKKVKDWGKTDFFFFF